MGERYWRAIASLLIASVILRRNDSGRTPGGADETDPRSHRLNRGFAPPVSGRSGTFLIEIVI